MREKIRGYHKFIFSLFIYEKKSNKTFLILRILLASETFACRPVSAEILRDEWHLVDNEQWSGVRHAETNDNHEPSWQANKWSGSEGERA